MADLNYREYLLQKAIKPSYSRMKVLEYLVRNATHPTADEIYQQLVEELPTLSKTTVYNTLKLLTEAGLAKIVVIEENEARFDGNVNPHGHFKCESCGRIYDFEIAINSFETKGLAGFEIHEKDVYFKGICSNCLEDKN
ncbi:MAG TPA: transcriptional repressor [Bacillota bacterium]|nr:transcriptional repressor [Bacillota bacterium]